MSPNLHRPNPVIFLAAWIDACALWREYLPHLNMPGSQFVAFRGVPDWSMITGNEIAVVQRCCHAQQRDFMINAANLGLRVIYDLDDDVWSLPKYNPAYKIFEANKQGFGVCMSHADVITVSTKTLAKAVRKHARQHLQHARTKKAIPIVVVENRLDTKYFVEPQPVQEPLTIGWAGSSSHGGDLLLVEQPLLTVTAEHPEVCVEFRGCTLHIDSPLLALPQYRSAPWMPAAEYASRMPCWGWSIALAPVQDLPFNDSKSAIKMVEAGYCGIPCLASGVVPYMELCHKDTKRELSYLLCTTPGMWERKLRELINEPERRAYYGARLREIVLEHYTWDKPHEGWQEALALARSA